MSDLHAESPFVGLLTALDFAARKHRQQRRKDTAASPYINHPIAVAELLARVGGVTDLATLQAALLHDTIEDTETTIAELDEYFGEGVRKIVLEVTDDKSLPKAERKRLQIEHSPHLSPQAKQVKLADKICNLGDITPSEPADWTLDRKLEYIDWGVKVVAGCRGCNPALEAFYDDRLQQQRSALNGLQH